MCVIGNHVYPQGYRGFESPPLRQPPPSLRLAGRFQRLTGVSRQKKDRHRPAEAALRRLGEGGLSSSDKSQAAVPINYPRTTTSPPPEFWYPVVLREPLRLVVLEPCTTSISSKAPTTTGRTAVFYSTRPPRKGRSPAYDLTLDTDEGRDYHGLTPNTFGSAPRLTTLAAVAADAGTGRDEFDKIDAEVSAVIQR